MKVIIQIPCYNEEQTLPETLADLPSSLRGVESIETLIIDDGSTDRTIEVARKNGVEHVIHFSTNRGLAAAFREGVQAALDLGADIIVNTDADNQYRGDDIRLLVEPIVDRQADIVIGDRQIWSHPEFSFLKKCLQNVGSWVVGHLAKSRVPDVTSGFRALSREAALQTNILSDYTYTQEMIIQAGQHNLKVMSVPITVNSKTRPSRLFKSIFGYILKSGATIIRIYTLYSPLKVFAALAAVPFLGGFTLATRFLAFYLGGQGAGHIQSLVFAAVLFNLSFLLFVLGVLADLIGFNRRLLENILVRSRKTNSLVHLNQQHEG